MLLSLLSQKSWVICIFAKYVIYSLINVSCLLITLLWLINVISFFSFGDRGKRLKLQQFIAKKADTLYDKSNFDRTVEPVKQELGDEGNLHYV